MFRYAVIRIFPARTLTKAFPKYLFDIIKEVVFPPKVVYFMEIKFPPYSKTVPN